MAENKHGRDWLGWVALLGLTAIAAWLRYHELDLKPLHHDEGVNAWFVNELVEDFKYRYNPYYYHGPALYFLTAPALMIFGKTAYAMRVVPALFGTLAVPAFALMRRRIGWMGVLVCGALTAVAPVEVYFSRTAIHEIYNFTFNFTLVGGIYLWWKSGSRWALALAAASLALLFATKETTAITVAAMVPAIVLTWLWTRDRLTFPGGAPVPRALLEAAPAGWRRRHQADAPPPDAGPWPAAGAPLSVRRAGERLEAAIAEARRAARDVQLAWAEAQAQAEAARMAPPPEIGAAYEDVAAGTRTALTIPVVTFVRVFLTRLWRANRWALITAVAVFLAVWALLFSSCFTYPKGLWGFFEAFFGWGKTGVEGKGHEKVWTYFMDQVLWPYYKPLLFFGLPSLIIGAALRDAFATFNLIWFALALAAYSVIPYKTPWCVISFSGPLFYGVGLGVAAFTRWAAELSRPALRPLAAALPLVALAWPVAVWAQESWILQMEEYDVDGHSVIYVQNVREFMDVVDDMRGVLKVAEDKGMTPKVYFVRAHNPLRWYLVGSQADMKWANQYSDGIKGKLADSDIVITQRSQAKEVEAAIDMDNYHVRWYHERPGQKLDVYISKPLWEQYEVAAQRGEVPPPHQEAPQRSFCDDRTREMRDAKKK